MTHMNFTNPAPWCVLALLIGLLQSPTAGQPPDEPPSPGTPKTDANRRKLAEIDRLEKVIREFEENRRPREAIEPSKHRAEILKEVYGDQSLEYASGLNDLARSLMRNGDFA